MEGPDRVKVSSDAPVIPGNTTLTVSAQVKDVVLDANTDTEPKQITVRVTVKISEVSAQTNIAGDEFVELYNAGNAPVDIGGWQLQYSAANPLAWNTLATLSAQTVIPAFGFYLIGSAGFTVSTDLGFGPDSLDLTGGHVRLFDGVKTIDKLGWGNAVSPEGQAASAMDVGSSLERKAFGESWADDMAQGGVDALLGNSWDTENNIFDFVVQNQIRPQNSASAPEEPVFAGRVAVLR